MPNSTDVARRSRACGRGSPVTSTPPAAPTAGAAPWRAPWPRGYLDPTSGANGRRGCLLVATAMELAGRDPEVDRRIASFFKAMETRVADALARAKDAHELADGVEPASAARMLVCFVEGLRVVGKTGPARSRSQATADALLDRFIR